VKLRRDSAVAMHRQLAQYLRGAIAKGAYRPGDRLPGEPQLAERHGVSRITARQAVLHLAREKLVVRRQGKGTFVAEPPVHHDLLDPHGIYDELVARGVNPATELLECGERVAPADVNERLRYGARKLIHWKRLYLRRGAPFAVSWVYLAPRLRPSREQIARHSTYQLFESVLGVQVSHADLSVRAHVATPELRRVLKLRANAPLIALERVSFDAGSAPLEHTLYWANPESYEFVLRLRGKIPITSAIQGIR
jgi:GntR family transcriptional regulator